jgi:hypothetical protein
MGGQHLLDGTERLAVKFAGDRIGSHRIRIDHANQPDASSLLQLMIDASVITAESTYADDRNIDREILAQMNAPERYDNALLSQLMPRVGKLKPKSLEQP